MRFANWLAGASPWIGAVLVLSSISAAGQQSPEVQEAIAACGPAETQIRVSRSASARSHISTADGAAVYLIGRSFIGRASGPTIRVGVNGQWVGAVKGSSWMAIVLAPGVHHFCAWQRGTDPSHAALNRFEIRAGETRYVAINPENFTGGPLIVEENADEAKLLMAQSPAVSVTIPNP
jgi:hypothetical protein